jgi:hypothetical protein
LLFASIYGILFANYKIFLFSVPLCFG